MDNILTPNNITFVLGIMGVIFGVYKHFKNPQIDSERKDALLAQQLQWTTEGSERKFKEIQDNFKDLLLQSNNHIHTVETKVDILTSRVGEMTVSLAKLSTIIDERMPPRKMV